jgi:hypothetical protein
MPRPTTQELQAARRLKQEEREREAQQAAEAESRRQQQENEHREWLVDVKERHTQLESAAQGLYDELDKLCRKWPNMPITQFMLTKVNKLIGAAKELLHGEEDVFADDITEIVFAGDMPETRDVVLVLREVRDALDRFKARYQSDWRHL